MTKIKTICKWKDIKCDLDLVKEIVRKPLFVCVKCGRAARKDKYLCKPTPID